MRAPLSRAEQPGHSLRELWNTLAADRYFLRFQFGFFLYGLAFMSISIARPLEMAGDDRLDFSYQTLLGARGVFSLSVLLSTLMMGRPTGSPSGYLLLLLPARHLVDCSTLRTTRRCILSPKRSREHGRHHDRVELGAGDGADGAPLPTTCWCTLVWSAYVRSSDIRWLGC